MHHKEIQISDRKSRSKEQTGSDRIRQEYTGSDRNTQDHISEIENYCTIKKCTYQIGKLEVPNRQEQTESDRIRQDQTGSDRNRQDYKSDIENYCIIIIEL